MCEMEEEDSKLSTCLQKLELEESKPSGLNPQPFRRRSKSLSSISRTSLCACLKKPVPDGVKKAVSFRRSNKKILRDPVLKIVRFDKKTNEKLFGQCSRHKEKDFKTLINACEQLTLDSQQSFSSESFKQARCLNRGSAVKNSSRAGMSSCSHQARLVNPPCDVTIDELASYFETSVHIPKKMSSMAEMMYI